MRAVDGYNLFLPEVKEIAQNCSTTLDKIESFDSVGACFLVQRWEYHGAERPSNFPHLHRYLAEWMVHGYPSESVWELDLKRFGALQSSRTFLRHRVMEVMRKWSFIPVAHRCRHLTGSVIQRGRFFLGSLVIASSWASEFGCFRPVLGALCPRDIYGTFSLLYLSYLGDQESGLGRTGGDSC